MIRPAPKGKKMRMDHPFILDFCQISLFVWYLQSFFNFLGKTHFLQLLSYFNSFVYVRFKYGRLQIITISKSNSYFKTRTCVGGVFLAGTLFFVFYVSWFNKYNMWSFRNQMFWKMLIFCQILHQISFRKDCYLKRKDYWATQDTLGQLLKGKTSKRKGSLSR